MSMASYFKCSAIMLLFSFVISVSLAGAEDRDLTGTSTGAADVLSGPTDTASGTKQPAGGSKVVVEIPRSQWCQCVRGLLGVEGGNIEGCVKSGVSEEKLKIFKSRGTGDGRSNSVSFLLSFAGCTETENENVGSLAFNVGWQDRPVRTSTPQAESAQHPDQSLAPVSCSAGGIARIEATLYSSPKKKLATAGPWNCSNLVGTLNNIPVGSGIKLVITGKNESGDVLYRGERTGIAVNYHQTSDLGTVAAPPFTPLLSSPANAAMLGSGLVNFAWIGASGATSYRIQIANNPNFTFAIDTAAAAAAYKSGKALTSGTYFWRVKARDDLNNSSEWSSPGSITIDAEPPINTTGKKFINTGTEATNSNTVSLTISAMKKKGSGITAYYISEQQKKPEADKTGWTAIASTMTYTADVPYVLSKRDGNKTIYVWFKDALGHISQVKSSTIIVDTNLPRATITSHPAHPTNSTKANFAFISSKARSKFQCKLDDGVYSACTSTKSYEGLLEGSHTFSVKVSDAIGNTDLTPASYTWTIDLTPPRTTITSKPQNRTDSDSASFSFTSSKAGSTFQCRIDGNEYTRCISPNTYTGLSKGSHTFTVKATDAAGIIELTPPQYTWTIVESFTVAITEHPSDPSRPESNSFSFTSNRDGAAFQCQLDSGEYAACTSPVTYTRLTEDSHTFSVKAIDATGNEESEPALYTWAVRLPLAAKTGISNMLDGVAIPDSPAFAALGVTPPLITRPASPHKLAFSLVEGFDQNGKIQSGIAVDMSPYLLMREKELTLEKYQNSKGAQGLSRIQLSFAVTRGAVENDTATRLATSVRWTIWDDGDIRLDKDLLACINGDSRESSDPGPAGTASGQTGSGSVRPYTEDDSPEIRIKLCRQESIKRNWNKSAADVGIAPSWIDKGGSTGGSLSTNGYSAWASVSYGFDRFEQLKNNSQITFLARYRKDETVPAPDLANLFLLRDRSSLGFQYRYGDPERTFFFQGLYLQSKTEGQGTNSSFPLSFGTDFKIIGNVWIVLEAGGFMKHSSEENPSFITAQIKWALY
jgi:hypothetical protein